MPDNILRLNMQILSDYLNDRCSDHVFYQNRDQMLLDGVRLYRGQEELFCCMYFLFPPDLRSFSSGRQECLWPKYPWPI